MTSSDILIFVCKNCAPQADQLPRQWLQNNKRVRLQELPCSGKVDGRYIMHALEEGMSGLCIVTCSPGECHLSQGNRRADIRVKTMRKLLGEIGLEPDRLQLIPCNGNGNSKETFRLMMENAVDHLSKNGKGSLSAV